MDRFYAHSVPGRDQAHWQPLVDHLMAVAELAFRYGAIFEAGKAAFLAGLLHDLGKYTGSFQRRLAGGVSVDHATAGAKEVAALEKAQPLMRQILAYVIAGHHAGLPDSADLSDRLAKPIDAVDPAWRQEIGLQPAGLMPAFRFTKDRDRLGFQLAFLGRMIFSCLIDADRTDTAAFDARSKGEAPPPDRPQLPAMFDRLRNAFDTHMSGLRRDGEVNALRGRILAHVRARAVLPPSLFTLTVPTGGGKTLASLGFALDHAKAHGLDRIVYAIPFTSVIDQTVDIFERVLGGDVVLAHHSGFDLASGDAEERFRAKDENRLRLAMQDWAMPVVVTTNVQLFESLFSHRPSRCRKLHSLARSVIVLDEAQTIPLHVLRPCLAALDELTRNYGCTVVLCTATQPAVTQPRFEGGLVIEPDHELAPDPDALHRQLRRVTLRHAGTMADADVVGELGAAEQGLVIVNTRAHALRLYQAAKAQGHDGLFHLTTRQYAAHRRIILDEVHRRLTEGQPCRLVATSLVEAGVDLDFARVWRAEAGLDSIVQASGRCNREGKRDRADSLVTVFEPADVKPPREMAGFIGDAQRAALTVDDLLSPQSVARYFQEVYWRKGKGLDQTRVPATGTAIEVLSKTTFGAEGTTCDFKYRTVGENFRLISDGMAPVIVPRDPEARDALAALRGPDVGVGGIARRLQPFLVQVPPQARALLLANGHVAFAERERFGDQFCVLRTPGLYDESVGLLWENPDYLGIESII